jgi:hypothetical protein
MIIAILVMCLGMWEINITFLSSCIVSIAIIYVVFKTSYQQVMAIFLGTILAVEGISDIQTILLLPGVTDAGILAHTFGMDFLAFPIALGFAFVSLFIWYLSIRYILKRT